MRYQPGTPRFGMECTARSRTHGQLKTETCARLWRRHVLE